MRLPSVLYRWIDDGQADRLLCGGGLVPTWTHLMPDTCRLERGICFGEDAWRWKEEHEYTVCVAISTDGIPDDLRPLHVDGNMLFAAGIEHYHLGKQARDESDPVRRTVLLASARAVAASLKDAHGSGKAEPDEWFFRGAIPDALERVVGMVVLTSASRQIQRLSEQGRKDGALKFPVERVSSRIDFDTDHLESEMRNAFVHLLNQPEPEGNALALG